MANTTNENFETVILDHVHVTTGNYREDPKSKLTREVKRKSAFISGPVEEIKKAVDLGMTYYNPKDSTSSNELTEDSFLWTAFSSKTPYYIESMKTREVVVFDDSLPNYEFNDASIVISKNKSETGQVFFRVSALRVANPDMASAFVANFFDDDNEFTTISQDGVNSLYLPGVGEPQLVSEFDKSLIQEPIVLHK